MHRRFAVPLLIVAAALGGLAGCAPAPFVFKADEFNRSSPAFNQDPKDRRSVLVCYNRRSASPEQVRQLAAEACTKVGKTARFLRHEYNDCPVSTFSGARFACGGAGSGGGSWGGQTSGPYSWSYTGPTEAPLLPPVPEAPVR